MQYSQGTDVLVPGGARSGAPTGLRQPIGQSRVPYRTK